MPLTISPGAKNRYSSLCGVYRNTSSLDENESIYIIVNADDYCYFPGVSRGIIDCVRKKTISAIGILPNTPYFDEHIEWLKELKDLKELDTGLHLNLTFGQPLSPRMRRMFSRWHGNFPGKYLLSIGVLTKQIPLTELVEECRAQIRRCLNAGLDIYFLNSHEHIHMLPCLFSKILGLADEYHIPYVRCSKPEWKTILPLGRSAGSWLRNIFLQALYIASRSCGRSVSPELLGMGASGKLTYAYLEKQFSSLQSGMIYELMCHPGFLESPQIDHRRLLSYHNWEAELSLLQSAEFRELCRLCGIQLLRFRDIIDRQ
jgi:chitin disaccharide deacetylase